MNSMIGLAMARPSAVLPIAIPPVFDLSVEQEQYHQNSNYQRFVVSTKSQEVGAEK